MRARRRELKITRNTAARVLRLSISQLDRLEKGRVSIQPSQIDRLCTLLDVKPSYFFRDLLPATGDAYGWRSQSLGKEPMFARALAFAAALAASATTAHAEMHEIIFAR